MYAFTGYQGYNSNSGGRHHPYNHHRSRTYKAENIYSAEYKNPYMTMLWDQTKQLPKDAFKLVEQSYEESGFYLEVRLHLAAFVEAKFMPNLDVDDATATNLATQLLSQLDAKIAAIPNDPDKFMSKSKLQDMYDNLKVNIAIKPLFKQTSNMNT